MDFEDFENMENEEMPENLDLLDSARTQILKSINEMLSAIKDNVKYKEYDEYRENVANILHKFEVLTELETLDLNDPSFSELVDNILKENTAITFNNIDNLLPNQEEDSSKDDGPKPTTGDGSLDW